MYVEQFQIIDEMFIPAEILAHINAMTERQKNVHIWLTATLDVAYPFAYGALFIGLTLRSFPVHGYWLMLPSILVIPVDLLEGVIQILLLRGHDDVVTIKSVVTALKLILFVTGLMVGVVATIRLLTSRKHRNP
ncbi:hypothetical protein [Alteromonas flava]|uniref:hypothetical protein n=1 Tax=Alteromonas flava TaxID=2048003 RepID=UPI000F5EFF2C|nr:hypothetical protein [Alteromonas flava]